MAKGKFQKWLTEDSLTIIAGWSRDGLTDAEIAIKMGIRTSTLYEWFNRFPQISDAVRNNKELPDYKVEQALYRRAIGYDYEETIKDIYSDGNTHIRKVTRHMPPDTAAAFIWLKNRRPDRWKDKPEAKVEELKEDDGLLEKISKVTEALFDASADDSAMVSADEAE